MKGSDFATLAVLLAFSGVLFWIAYKVGYTRGRIDELKEGNNIQVHPPDAGRFGKIYEP